MASNAVDIGTGATLTLGTSSWETGLQIEGMEWSGVSRESVETTHLATAASGAGKFGTRTFIPGMMADPGEITFEVQFNPDTTPPIEDALETLTVTYLGPDDAAGATWASNAFCTGFDGPNVGIDEKMMATVTYKLSGNVTITADA